MKPPAYLEMIEKMIRDGVISLEPGMVDVYVAHDPKCALLNGLLTCDCQPTVTVRAPREAA